MLNVPVFEVKPGIFRPVELSLLALLLIAVPALEAPKNIFCALFLLTWTISRIRERNWGGPFDVWDALILFWITSGLVAAAFAGLPPRNWVNAMDPLRYGLVLLALKRSGYPIEILLRILVVTIGATLVTLMVGFWELYGSQRLAALELHSVGHVNHSAIYIAISFAMAVAIALSYWGAVSAFVRGLMAMAVAFLFVGILVSSSRGAIGAALVAILILGIGFWKKLSRSAIMALVVCIVLVVAGVVSNPAVIKKHNDLADASNAMSFRPPIWNVAMAAWHQHPWTGVGPSNFSLITMERIKAWRKDSDPPIDEAKYFPFGHAHSVFFNTLAERGTYGFAALMLFLIAWTVDLIRKRPAGPSPHAAWAIWGASVGALVIDVVAGAVNTTLHHEHAILSSVCIGCWLSQSRSTPTVDSMRSSVARTER